MGLEHIVIWTIKKDLLTLSFDIALIGSVLFEELFEIDLAISYLEKIRKYSRKSVMIKPNEK